MVEGAIPYVSQGRRDGCVELFTINESFITDRRQPFGQVAGEGEVPTVTECACAYLLQRTGQRNGGEAI